MINFRWPLMVEFGARLSETKKRNYKLLLWLIPLIIILTLFLSISDLIYLIIGFSSIIFIFAFSTQLDQFTNHEAFEKGLKIPVPYNFYRKFVPYTNITYVCRFDLEGKFWRVKFSKGYLLFYRKPSSKRIEFYMMSDVPWTPFNKVLPILYQLPSWNNIYHPDVCYTDFRDILKYYNKLNK
jgi:hypothetical protein